MPLPLIVVDVQNGFLNEYTHHIPDRIRRLVGEGRYRPLYFTRFVNTEGSPYRKFLDWHECATPPATDIADALREIAQPECLFVKQGFTGLPDALAERLRQEGYGEVAVAGVDTEMCVLKTALDLFDLGIRPIVLVDCCSSTAGLPSHLAGLAILSRNVGPRQLRYAGLEGDTLAAPDD